METESPFPDDLGARIRAARSYARMSQADLAALFELVRGGGARFEETAGSGLPDWKVRARLHKLAKRTHLPYEFFFIDWEVLKLAHQLVLRDALSELADHLGEPDEDAEGRDDEEHYGHG